MVDVVMIPKPYENLSIGFNMYLFENKFKRFCFSLLII